MLNFIKDAGIINVWTKICIGFCHQQIRKRKNYVNLQGVFYSKNPNLAKISFFGASLAH